MRKVRFWVAGAFLAVLVGACTSPTMTPYPTPDNTLPKDPDPGQGLVVPNR